MIEWSDRIEHAETDFKMRYNRNVHVYTSKGNTNEECIVKIIYKQNEYILKEELENELTKRVFITIGDKTYQTKSYLEGEVFVADNIGGKYG